MANPGSVKQEDRPQVQLIVVMPTGPGLAHRLGTWPKMKEGRNMNVFNPKSIKLAPKFVLLVPCLVLFAACASKEIQNASLEPLELPAEESSSYTTPEPEGLTAPTAAGTVNNSAKKSAKKYASKSQKASKKMARMQKRKKTLIAKPTAPAPTAAAQVQSTEQMPVIGDGSLATAPIQVDPMAPPVPFDTGFANVDAQPNWLLAGLMIAGIVLLSGLAFRMRRLNKGKRRLIYNA